MIDYIKGKISELTPTRIVLENAGIGYAMEISLQTYSAMENKGEGVIYIQKQVNPRDGSDVDYGFATKDERALFQLITGVSGMGAASARMVLSSMNSDEFQNAILSEDINRIKSVKGIGLKTAQRLILELKDKIFKGEGMPAESEIFKTVDNQAVEEATQALVMLGFAKPAIAKAIQKITAKNPDARVEEIIKSALQIL
ncbi:MAG: Holliday junction branch migration protein RuvA [Bacteroidales bacterium]|nr:Holliday junction branch migration protein RuvA [Bacteroidales bacterium]